ncbi:ATP-binding cassette domain-containing protein [Furfurilactobacillus rossiae]|nr:ATP-binding cassette domain-containing protein [Furfurilactobacillus rossiae]
MVSNMSSIIELKNVSKKFKQLSAISNVNLSVDEGEIIGLVGENGAGKTTLINLILGLQKPDTGQIKVFGTNPGTTVCRNQIGAMLQENVSIKNLHVDESFQLVRSFYTHPLSLKKLLTLTGLREFRHHNMSALSGGQRRQLAFGIALAGNPRVIFLDEPTVGLDSIARTQFWQSIEQLRHQGKTIFVTSHYLEEIEAVAERLLILQHGKIKFDGPLDALTSLYSGATATFESELAVNYFKTSPLVLEAKKHGDKITLKLSDGDLWLLESQPFLDRIHRLSLMPNSLNEIFTDVTQTGGRNHESAMHAN